VHSIPLKLQKPWPRPNFLYTDLQRGAEMEPQSKIIFDVQRGYLQYISSALNQGLVRAKVLTYG
jgi:hypothetical protein